MAKTPARSKKVGAKKSAPAKAKASGASSKGRGAKKATPVRSRRGATKVMGMTIPKGLTDALDALINSPRGREILASAIVAAASAAAASLVRSDSPQAAKAREAITDAGDQVASATKDLSTAAAGALAGIVTGAASALLPSPRSKPEKKAGEGE